MLLWIGTAFTGIVSLLAATASFKASQIFTEVRILGYVRLTLL